MISRNSINGAFPIKRLAEVVEFLDSQRRQDLIEVLKKLSIMPQLIVVTHDAALEEASDKINFVKKEKGVSSVE